MSRHVVERSTRLAASAAEVFAWHMRPGALERLTPPWEDVRVLRRDPRGVAEGSRVVLAIGAGPARMRWTVEHRGIVPDREFRDEQVAGPFASWVHLHRMEPDGDGCRLTDRIEYATPLGPAGDLADALVVRRRLERMLAYRHATIAADLAAHRRLGGVARHFAVTGASGLIGRALVPFLTTGGHRVTRIVRQRPGPDEIHWDPPLGELDGHALEGTDAVIHLAGEGIADHRWTEAQRRRIVQSRTDGTGLLAATLARLARPPAALVSASAVGIYGDRGDEPLTEASPAGSGFLPDVCRQWERAAAAAVEAGIRTTHPRTGVVLTPAGGALAKLLLPFRMGVGGRLGDGEQWMSPISIDDHVEVLYRLALDPALRGPVNAVLPAPVRNAEFTALLARLLGRPALVPVPAEALRLLVGELADAALLASARVLPRRLEEAGHPFRHPTSAAALTHVLGLSS